MFVFLALLVVVFGAPVPVKNLAGPVEEFGFHRVPDPATVLVSSASAALNLWFDCDHCKSSGLTAVNESTLLSSTQFPVDGFNMFVLNFASPIASSVRLELLKPDGVPVDHKDLRVEKGEFEIDDNAKDKIPTTTFIVSDVTQGGLYTFNIYSQGLLMADWHSLQANPRPDAVLTFINNDEYEIHSHVQSYLLSVGEPIGLVSYVGSQGVKRASQDVVVKTATMEVIAPDGSSFDVKMKDDGLSGDLLANDGIYGATIKATQAGVYILQANMGGYLGDGIVVPFQRTTQHPVFISDSTLKLSGVAKTSTPKDEKIDILIGLNSQTSNTRIRAYAEVWGTDSKGALIPACWIGGVVESTTDGEAKLVLDLQWLERAGVQGPLELKNVYISDLATSFPIDIAAQEKSFAVKSSEFLKLDLTKSLTDIPITNEMRFGKNPLPPVNKSALTAPPAHNLLLLPGYCADTNPWTRDGAKFSGGFFPVAFGNHANDDYAQKIMAMAQEKGMESFGAIGHSQGGMISLHIHNFYWTGFSKASGSRLIQTVGTPWQGSTAAGDAANLGNIFGIGCGKSTDLSRDGAANWLSGISMAARKDVHYYTTTYEQGRFFGDWCSLPMNLILQWPNDGLVELTYAHLPGALHMGNKEKWCHTTDMTYKPQYDDAARNTEMNHNAAR